MSVVLTSKLKNRFIHFTVTKYGLGFNTINSFTDQQKWKLLNLVEYTYDIPKNQIDPISRQPNSKYLISTSPRLQFTCFASRRPFYYFANAYCLIFLITITSIGTFAIDCNLSHNRLHTTATIFLTSVSFKWVTNRKLPAVCYTTSLDLYSIFSIIFICLIFSWHSVMGAFNPRLNEYDSWMLLIFCGLFVLLQTFFVFRTLSSYLIILKIEKKAKAFSKQSKSQ